jgi:hypothetical protein
MTTENWIKTDVIKDSKQRANKLSAQDKAEHEGKKQVTIPHPTLKKTFIIKYI